MSIEIKISDDLGKAAADIAAFNHDIIPKAARRALNRAATAMGKESTKLVPKEMRIRPGMIRERYMRLRKVRQMALQGMSAEAAYSAAAIPLIEFVRGSKDPIRQAGIKVKNRKPLRVEIRPGKRFILKRAFIQKVVSKQVFKRPGKGKEFKKQGAPSIGFLIMSRNQRLAGMVAQAGGETFQRVFKSELAFRLSQRT